MFTKYQQSLQKMDALEHKLEEKVLEKRHRALNLLDEFSNVRRSTLRLFVTHEYEYERCDCDADNDNDDDDHDHDNENDENKDQVAGRGEGVDQKKKKGGENNKDGGGDDTAARGSTGSSMAMEIDGGDGSNKADKGDSAKGEGGEMDKDKDEERKEDKKDNKEAEKGQSQGKGTAIIHGHGNRVGGGKDIRRLQQNMNHNNNNTNDKANTTSEKTGNNDDNDNDVTMKDNEKDNHDAAAAATTKANTNTNNDTDQEPKPKAITKWKLVIEGKQLIPQLDHQSSKQMEKYHADGGIGNEDGDGSDGHSNNISRRSNSNVKATVNGNSSGHGHYKYLTQTTDAAKLSVYNKMTEREKMSSRFSYDREGEDVPQPLLFTHFWDRISVSFQPYCRKVPRSDVTSGIIGGTGGDSDDVTAAAATTAKEQDLDGSRSSSAGGSIGGSKKRKRSPTTLLSPSSSSLSASGSSSASKKKGHHNHHNQAKAQKQGINKPATFKTNGPPTSLIWNRSSPSSLPTASSTAFSTAPTDDKKTDGISTSASSSSNTNNPNNNNSASMMFDHNQDSHAFHAVYEQHHHDQPLEEGETGGGCHDNSKYNIEDEHVLEHMIVATIRLHRRANYSSSGNSGSAVTSGSSAAGFSSFSSAGGSGMNTTMGSSSNACVQKYKLSKILCSTLFPCFLPKKGGGKLGSGGTGSSNSNSGGGSVANASNNLTDPSSSNMPPLDNDIQIPKVFTMDELLTAFYIYITDNKLQQPPSSSSSSSGNTTAAATSTSASTLSPLANQQNDESKTLATGTGTKGTTEGDPPTPPVTSLIYNDSKLQSVFHKSTMHFHEIQQLLLSKNLIIPAILGTPGDAPIVLTYIMKSDNASVNEHYVYEDDVNMRKNKKSKAGKEDEEEKGKKEADDIKKKDVIMEDQDSRVDNVEEIDKKDSQTTNEKKPESEAKELSSKKKSDTKGDRRRKGELKATKTSRTLQKASKIPQDYETLPNLLSCDIDIDVPHLYHFRTRDILRRIKIREYEYQSVRTQALRSIQQTRISQNDAKMLLEDIVKGIGYTKHHIPACLALAKASQEGGEARIGSHIDARISTLMDRLEYHTRNAKACWDVVDTCRSVKLR